MTSINLQDQSAPYAMSEPSKTGRLDVTWSGGVGSIDYGKIVTSGGARRSHRRKHRRSHRRSHRFRVTHVYRKKRQTRNAKRSKSKDQA